ncbi:MAG: PAS domain-containing sensor histidine kinase [Thiotrichaceae bacterium]
MTLEKSLFYNEEIVIERATCFLAQLKTKEQCSAQEYEALLNSYKKLLKQTKLLVKFSDRQQRDKNYEVEEITESSEKKLAQFLEAIPVGVFVVNVKGSPYYANQKAREILGGDLVDNIYVTDLPNAYQAYIAGTNCRYPIQQQPIVRALHGERVYVDDMEIYQTHRIIPLEVWGVPIFNEAGQVSYAIAVFQDITERKQAEANRVRLVQEQEAKNAALRYTHEIEVKNQQLICLNQERDEFLGIVVHDLKNPLQSIQGAAELIETAFCDFSQAELVDFAQLISESSRRMFELISNLLDVNRIESGKYAVNLQEVNLVSIIYRMVKDYTQRAQAKDITLHFDVTVPKLAWVDKNIVVQILENLISNAIKYSPTGKQVYIRLLSQQHYLRCEIEDEGPGISAEDQEKLFGKFNRLTARPTAGEHSTGLGLFIVKKLVEAIDASVWCQSQLGSGCTFIVEFLTKKQ